ncbi:Common central domain of tyrosinase [Pedobacter steynii]|uniref:Common central domain of tyrosinase n=1 Tax=Pedobacter steynii TaxID=430522 RepID=A0A1G9LEN0_9SPHI|nr:tyrosinase family protein [Pedobacter steynii]NQX38824.1 tyrosinase family protein [Pedobacter steynii]SDL60326.1 Common central domain of tyrosinase [Pedobacter steynii]
MKFILKINGSESPTAAYVGWTPVKCTLTISDYTGQSPMPVLITAGNDNLDGQISLYNSNKTSSEPVDKIEHDFQTKSEISFYVAGKYPHASVGKKDTFLKIENKSNQVPTLTTKIMVRVRKNANNLKPNEIEAFLSSFVALGKRPPKKTYPGANFTQKPNSLIDEIVLMHTYDAMQEIHQRTSFHPWHRAFLSHLERELQEVDATVTVPYWRFDKKAENVFNEYFIGKTEQSVETTGPSVPAFNKANPLYSYKTVWGDLVRGYWGQNPANGKTTNEIYDQKDILKSFTVSNPYSEGINISSEKFKGWAYHEETRSHNEAHSAFSGHVADPGKDPVDPLFFMMHGNVDRLWALWQRKYNRFSPTDPDTYPYQGKHPGHTGPSRAPRNRDKGNFLKDTLWPWDMDNAPIRPARRWNFQNVPPGIVPQINIKFPSSIATNAPGISPTLESMIDYQGRLNAGITLGFDYDEIPYFDHNPITPEVQIAAAFEEHNKVFLNSGLPLEERLSAASNARIEELDEFNALLNIIKDQSEAEQIRIQSIRLADKTNEQFLDTGLTVLKDGSEPETLRSELIHAVSNAKRSNLHFPSRQPEFFNTLRGLMKSDSPLLRSQSIEILSANQDEAVQEFLVEDLSKEENALMPKKDAIAFLAQNPKPQHTDLFLKAFEQDNNEEVKIAALKAMGKDQASVDLLKNVVLKGKSFKIREAGALALHQLDTETMNNLAVQIITQPAKGIHKTFFSNLAPGEADFKAGLLNMLTFTGDINQLKQNDSLKTSLSNVKNADNDNKSGFSKTFKTAVDSASVTADITDEPDMMDLMATKLLRKFDADDEVE